jgi:formate-dependent nitrite reductase membrane component NrfD
MGRVVRSSPPTRFIACIGLVVTTPTPPQHVNIFFRWLVPVVGLFVITMFAFIATLLGDPMAARSPAQEFLDRHVVKMFLVEVVAIVGLSVAAMVLDRRQTLRHRSDSSSSDTAEDVANSSPGDAPQS